MIENDEFVYPMYDADKSRALALMNIERQAAAINALRSVIQTSEYRVIVEVLTFWAAQDFKNRIIITGVGKNSNIAAKISETMASLGLPSMYLNTAHTGHGDFGFIGPNDVIIHISRSGTTREMLETIKHVKTIRPYVNQFLIHCKPSKPANPDVNIELCIGAVEEGDEFGLAPTTSTTALLCVLDCMAVQVSHNIGFKRLDFLKYHPDGALGAMLKAESESAANLTVAPVQDANVSEVLAQIRAARAARSQLQSREKPEEGMEFK